MVPTSVTLACVRCGASAAPGAAFCSACGAPLAGGPGAGAVSGPANAAGPAPGGTRVATPPGGSTRPAIGAAATYAPVPAIDALARRLAGALGPSYEVGTLLGRGGFAEVYAVRDLRLKRDLAVKVLRPDLVLTEALLDRFRREAETVAALRHPHIIPIFDIGERDGLVYLVMPLIRGETLRARLQREERIEPDVARRVLHEAALALAAAHEAGIVHRDVKPDNIMLEGRAARVLLMDFGIAKALDAGPEAGAALTQTGMALGTPHYMSPEQAFGERTVDGRTDQYSLAVVGYAMLSGRLPFPGDSVAMVLKQQISDDATPLRALAPDAPDDLVAAIDRAMRKDPAGRFASAEEFAAELAPPAGADVLRLPAAPARIALAARPAVRAGALAVTLVAFTLFAWLWPRTRPAELVPFSLTRDAGMAQARAFLERQGGPRYQKEYLALRHDDWALQSLRWALGPEGAARWLAAHGGYRAWTLRWVQPPSREEWSAEVGEGGRLAAFTHVLADSARPPEVAEPEARAAAEAFLAASGYPVAGLAPFESGVERDRGRTSRKFAWAEPGTVVPAPPSAGATVDSAFVRLDVTVQGDRVTRFRRVVSVPETFRATIRSRLQTRSLPGMVIVVGGLIAGVGGLVLAARRTRLTALPWRAATGTGIVLGLLFAAGQGLNTTPVWAMRREPDSNWTAGFIQDRLFGQTLIVGLLLGAVLVPTIATVVPLLRATRAESAAGVEPVLHGRPRRGALLDACLLGYPMAGLLLLATLPTPPWRPPSGDRYPELFNLWLPVTPLTEGLYVTVLTAVLVVLGVVVVSSWVRRPAVAVAALVAAAAAAGAVLGGWRGAVSLGGTAAVFAAGGWWVGLLPVVVAGYVSAAAEAATSLLALGDAGYATAGGVAVALAFLPVVLALAARRDHAPGAARTGGRATPSPAGAAAGAGA